MSKGYFKRVSEETLTRLWINNPTLEETDLAIEAGAINLTTNPAYSSKMIMAESEREYVQGILDRVIEKTYDDREAAKIIQRKLVSRIMDKFLPLYEESSGIHGFVSIQGDPYEDDNTELIIKDALKSRELGKNFIAKIPVTKTGLNAMEFLIKENVPVIATEVMALSQAIETCELYTRVSKESGKYPSFFLTHITGIFDEYLAGIAKREGIDISSEILSKAGTIIAHKQYKLCKDRKYNCTILGGGARSLDHFTEMVGGNMHVTINWNTAKELIDIDGPVVSRVDDQTPDEVINELCEKIPDFYKAYVNDGLTVDEFKDFGPVVHFRNQFVKGWDILLNSVKEHRTKKF